MFINPGSHALLLLLTEIAAKIRKSGLPTLPKDLTFWVKVHVADSLYLVHTKIKFEG